MGIKYKVCILLLILMISLTGCLDYNTADINMAGIPLEDIYVGGSSAYYLSEDGILYSPGANVDAGRYVVYQDSKKGIVAENVRTFGLMSYGGYYITNDDELYIWNLHKLPLYNYNHRRHHKMILKDVKGVSLETDCMVYIDINNNLYLVGEFSDESYSIEQPKLLDNNVVDFSWGKGFLLWERMDGTIKSYGDIETSEFYIAKLKEVLDDSEIQLINIDGDMMLVLQGGKLWFYGDYEKLITGECSTNEYDWILLKQDVINVSTASVTLACVDSQGGLYIWGKCLSNGLEDTTKVHFDYYEDYKVASDAKIVCVNYGFFGYIDTAGNSKVFNYGGPKGFYGNSTDDECVGINREPITWVK